MKKFLLVLAVAAMALLVDSQSASARRGGCGGGCGHSRGHQSCCGSSCSTGGCSTGGCYTGGCATGGCGSVVSGCSSCGGGTCAIGGSSCVGGVCAIGGGASYAQANGNEATLVVTLPADATLSIDDATTSSISANRVFVTPALEAGKEYEYTLKAQIVRDGKKQIVTEKVTVRAGKTSQVELKLPAASIAAQ